MNRSDLLLREYRPKSALITGDHTPASAKFPVIDAHTHVGNWNWNSATGMPSSEGDWQIPDVPAAQEMLAGLNIRALVNLDGGWGPALQKNIARYPAHHPGRFAVFGWVDWLQVGERDFGERWAGELERSVQAGAAGLKVFKTLGLEHRDPHGRLIMPDDERLDPVWARAGELGIPVLIHTADPLAFFWPLDETNERWEELSEHPGWHFYGGDFPAFMDLIERLLRVVERHPRTNFIGAHVLSYSENLAFVAQALDRYPNLYVDIAARIGELGRQPYTARKFLIQHANRVLFGTDTFSPSADYYRTHFRFLETEDEYFDYGGNQGRWKIYGLHLPDDVLKKIYHENALRLIPGLEI